MTIATEEAAAASGERDAAERARLLEVLGADPTARTQPPHIRAQVTSLEKEQKARATRFTRDVVDRALVDLLSVYRDALVCAPGRARRWSTRTAGRSCSGWPSVLGPDDLLARDGRHRHRSRAHRRQRQPAAGPRGDGARPAPAPVTAIPDRDRTRSPPRRSLAYRAPMIRRRVAALAGATVALLVLSGCSVVDGVAAGAARRRRCRSRRRARPPGSEALARFYGQRLDWTECEGAQCADPRGARRLRRPAGRHHRARAGQGARQARVEADRLARRQPRRARAGQGSTTPGPRTSSSGKGVRDAYDVVGFDPRGVRRSAPIDCVTDTELDAFLGSDPTPDDAAEEQAFAPTRAGLRPVLRPHRRAPPRARLDRDAARDMDVLRAALGEEKLTYLGKSYGTYLGDDVRRPVPRAGRPDGPRRGRGPRPDAARRSTSARPRGSSSPRASGRPTASRRATARSARSVDEVMDGPAHLPRARSTRARCPAPATTRCPGSPRAGPRSASPPRCTTRAPWQTLVDAMRDAVGGDGTALMQLANQYADRNPGGQYAGNIMEVIYAVNCLDKPDSDDLDGAPSPGRGVREAGTDLGRRSSCGARCRAAPGRSTPTGAPERISAEGADPVVVIGTTRDPATPYEWAVRLREQLERRLARHLRRRRAHRVHPVQRLRRRRRRRATTSRARCRRTGCAADAPHGLRAPGIRGGDGGVRILVRRARARSGARRLSSVGQSDSLVMNRSRVRFP